MRCGRRRSGGCAGTAQTGGSAAADSGQAASGEAAKSADQQAADKVAALIDQIYVQERTDQTDAQCAEAKAAWIAFSMEPMSFTRLSL